MVCFRKKAQQSMEQMAIIIAAIVGLIVILLIYTASTGSFLNFDFFSETACWSSNGIQCGGGVFALVPNLCTVQKIDEPLQTETELAELLRNTYYMYHQSKCDFDNVGGQVYPVYFFEVKEEMDIVDFIGYLFENNRGTYETEITKTDLAYLEENTVGHTLCFDKRDSGIANYKLEPGETYYIHYWDRETLTDFSDQGDRIMITTDAHMTTTQEEMEEIFIPDWTASGIASQAGEYLLLMVPGVGTSYFAIKTGYIIAVSNEVADYNCLDYGLVAS
jgi:hypothetical protein